MFEVYFPEDRNPTFVAMKVDIPFKPHLYKANTRPPVGLDFQHELVVTAHLALIISNLLLILYKIINDNLDNAITEF